MTADRYRALCLKLADWIDDQTRKGECDEHPLVSDARALLDEPVGEVSDDEILELADDSDMDRFEGERSYPDGTVTKEGYWEAWDHQLLPFARALLSRYGTPGPCSRPIAGAGRRRRLRLEPEAAAEDQGQSKVRETRFPRKRYPGLSFTENFLGGHLSLGPVMIYGENAMHWAVNINTRWGYLCFRLPFCCFGRWWPLYCYLSPDATPSSATWWGWGKRRST